VGAGGRGGGRALRGRPADGWRAGAGGRERAGEAATGGRGSGGGGCACVRVCVFG
jgi:hypothetical protein